MRLALQTIALQASTVGELAAAILATKAGIGMVAPFYAETASVKGDLEWPLWIVRNKTCNSTGHFYPRKLAEELACEMNRLAEAALLRTAALNNPETVVAAIASIPSEYFWLLAKGRLSPAEPLYAIQLLEAGTNRIVAEAESDDIAECIRAAIAKVGAA